jgi:hypothetical protein
MPTELVEACGLKRRRKSLRAAFAEAREIDQLFRTWIHRDETVVARQ